MKNVEAGQVWRSYREETGAEKLYYVCDVGLEKDGVQLVEVVNEKNFTYLKPIEFFEELELQYTIDPVTGEKND